MCCLSVTDYLTRDVITKCSKMPLISLVLSKLRRRHSTNSGFSFDRVWCWLTLFLTEKAVIISLFIVNLIYEVYLLVSIECVFTEKTAHCLLHCELSLAAQCIVIGLVCVRVCNGRTGGMCGRIDPHQTGFL